MKNTTAIAATALACACLALPPGLAAADLTLVLGARLLGGTWQGSNDGGNGSDFETRGTQAGINATLVRGRLYAGLSLQGGEYRFSDGAPDRVGIGAGASPRRPSARIARGEFDLSVGYFFWDRVSLFVDAKASSSEYQDEDYLLEATGLGFGVSGFHPLNEHWSLFATVGVVPLKVAVDDSQIGDGRGSALEFGARYRLNQRSSFSFSLKNQHQRFEFDSGAVQEHDIGGLLLGYQYGLPL